MSLQLIPPDINLDFVGKRKFFVALSTVINLAAIVLLIFVGLNYGVDFAGGSLVQLKFDRPTSADQIRKALGSLDLGEITVQDFGGSSSNQYLVRFAMVKNIGSLGKRLEVRSTRVTAAATRRRCCGSRRWAPKSGAISESTVFWRSRSPRSSWGSTSRSSSVA